MLGRRECAGCVARQQAIERLWEELGLMRDQILTLKGRDEATSVALRAAPEPAVDDKDETPEKAQMRIDEAAYEALATHAAAAGLDISEYRDL